MLLSVFEKYLFLQSLGWGIANSLWQAGILWLLYKIIVSANRNSSALFKHHLSLLLFFASFVWFAATTILNYLLVLNDGSEAVAISWLNISDNFITSLQYVSLLYLSLLLFHCFLFIKKLKSLFSLKHNQLIKAPVSVRVFAEQTALHIGIKKKVSIWLSEKTDVPSVIGFIKPVILLPVTALNNLTTAQAEAVILHELAHIKRNDYIINFVQCFIELVMFFNPFVKMLGNAARKERENCCDDWVLNYRYNKHDYASALMLLEQSRLTSVQFALAATNGKKNLLDRIKRLFAAEPQVNFSLLQKIKFSAVSILLAATVLLVLPFIDNNKTAVAETVPLATTTQENIAATPLFASINETQGDNYSEIKPLPVITNDAVPASAEEKCEETEAQAIETDIPETETLEEHTTALINEELLKAHADKQLQEMALQVANKGLEIAQSMIVKIEEEQSGTKDKKTYLVELKNNNGNPEVKPLIILNKKVKELSEKVKAQTKSNIKLADSLKAIASQFRITS